MDQIPGQGPWLGKDKLISYKINKLANKNPYNPLTQKSTFIPIIQVGKLRLRAVKGPSTHNWSVPSSLVLSVHLPRIELKSRYPRS